MLRINIQLITAFVALLFIFSGCGEDETLFTEKEMECMDISSLSPQIQMTGNFTGRDQRGFWAAALK
jgi:hypothetical protein